MKVLVVCSINSGSISPFIGEQVESLRQLGVKIDFFLLKGKGILGYIRNIPAYFRTISTYKPELIHAHYGLSGLFSNLQRKIPVITTYHGCDINVFWLRFLSAFSILLSKHNIFISNDMACKSFFRKRHSVISSGINMDMFYPVDKKEARSNLNLKQSGKLILFSGSFQEKVKNYPLAREAVNLAETGTLIELKGYSRNEVNLLMNACDLALLTSYREGSPQFIKEAMACNTPIVSVDVGDIRNIISVTNGCFLAKSITEDIAEKINMALEFSDTCIKTNGRERIVELQYDIENISLRILNVYQSVLA